MRSIDIMFCPIYSINLSVWKLLPSMKLKPIESKKIAFPHTNALNRSNSNAAICLHTAFVIVFLLCATFGTHSLSQNICLQNILIRHLPVLRSFAAK